MITKTELNLPAAFRTGMAALLLAMAVVLSGCAAVIVGAGAGAGVAYKMGQMEATAPADLRATVTATDDAFAHLQLALVSKKVDAFGAEFIGRTALDHKISVKLTGMTDTATTVRIRIGVFGDEAMSLKVYDQIRAGLATR